MIVIHTHDNDTECTCDTENTQYIVDCDLVWLNNYEVSTIVLQQCIRQQLQHKYMAEFKMFKELK